MHSFIDRKIFGLYNTCVLVRELFKYQLMGFKWRMPCSTSQDDFAEPVNDTEVQRETPDPTTRTENPTAKTP